MLTDLEEKLRFKMEPNDDEDAAAAVEDMCELVIAEFEAMSRRARRAQKAARHRRLTWHPHGVGS